MCFARPLSPDERERLRRYMGGAGDALSEWVVRGMARLDGEAKDDCPACQNLRGENSLLSDGYLLALRRLGAVRRLQEALARSPWHDEQAVSVILEEILGAPDELAVAALPGPVWTEDLRPVVRLATTANLDAADHNGRRPEW